MLTLLKDWKVVALLILIGVIFYLGYQYRGTLADRDTLKVALVHQQANTAEIQSKLDREQKVRAAEQAAALTQNDIATNYEQGKQDGKTELDAAISHLHSVISLRDKQLATANTINNQLSGIAARACSNNGSSGCEFLKTHGVATLRLAADADDAINALSACQNIILNDRKICNGR